MSKQEVKEMKELLSSSQKFFKSSKFQIALTVILFLLILFNSANIRLSSLPNLIDATTGDYTLSDPDALYFLRMAEVVVNTGSLEGVDNMRSPGANIHYIKEIMPYCIAYLYKGWTLFNKDISLNYVAAVSNVFFYGIGLVVFFFLVYVLTKSKTASLLASAFLAYSPAYLFRTMAGVPDHDALGMIGFFAILLSFVYAIKKHRTGFKQTTLWGIILGLFTGFTLAAWSGAVTFIFLIIPISFLLIYLFDDHYDNLKEKQKLISLYLGWIIFYLLSAMLFGFAFSDAFGKLLVAASLLVPGVIGLIIVDTVFIYGFKNSKLVSSKYRLLYSALIAAILGILALIVHYGSLAPFIEQVYTHLINPFGIASETGGRLGLTVSENQQPYAVDWISQTGKVLFYFFVFGIGIIGFQIAKEIKSNKHKLFFSFSWILAIIGLLFSRYSSSSIFNGDNFISRAVYILGFLIFIAYFAWLYFNDRFKIRPEIALMFAWMIVMLVVGRSAARTIFVATPFVCFAAVYFIMEIYAYTKRARDETLRYIAWTVVIVALLFSATFMFGNPFTKSLGTYQIVSSQAQSMGPVANDQWQSSMAWVRNNTGARDIFVHWWDYGYLVQTVGKRPSVSDGGHSAGDGGDHNVGRYLLTTPNPETALSYMKSWNVSYLLIDPTELGKYGAYSRIGGDKNHDRYANPAVIVSDAKQTVETANSTKRIYQGTTFVDADISYDNIFLPGTIFDKYQFAYPKSYFIGTIIEFGNNKNDSVNTIKQPQAVFVYNNKQFTLPVRYVYYNNRIIDFKTGINSTIMLIPLIQQTTTGKIQIDNLGAGIYMSERVQEGLFARLYLMNDPYNQYPTLTTAHFEDDQVVKALKAQGMDLGEFVYFQGFRGPLKIWNVTYPDGTKTHAEFLENGIIKGYGGLDYLFE